MGEYLWLAYLAVAVASWPVMYRWLFRFAQNEFPTIPNDNVDRAFICFLSTILVFFWLPVFVLYSARFVILRGLLYIEDEKPLDRSLR